MQNKFLINTSNRRNLEDSYERPFDLINNVTGTGSEELDELYRNQCELKTECFSTCCVREISVMECGK